MKSTASKIKEIEFTARIADGDFFTKVRHAEEFLAHGNKVKLRLKFRGREMAHTDIGFNLMIRAVAELVGMAHPDAPPKLIGRNIHVMLTPLAPNKRKPKWHVAGSANQAVDDGPEQDNDEDDEGDPSPVAAPKAT